MGCNAEPQKEHQWLHKFVGRWTYEADCSMGPDTPPMKMGGSETVRSIGGLWIVSEGQGEMPSGGQATMMSTLGYDPRKGRYVGTWLGSMMNNLWVYDGQMDAAWRVLTLSTEGPSFTDPGKIGQFRDVWELVSDDQRVLTSHMHMDDGSWVQFMRADYRRAR